MGKLRDEIYEMAIDYLIDGDTPEQVAREITYALVDFIQDKVHIEKRWIHSLIKLSSELSGRELKLGRKRLVADWTGGNLPDDWKLGEGEEEVWRRKLLK